MEYSKLNKRFDYQWVKIEFTKTNYPLKIATQLHIVTKMSGKINDILNLEECLIEQNTKQEYTFYK
jgi:hypothetical protein